MTPDERLTQLEKRLNTLTDRQDWVMLSMITVLTNLRMVIYEHGLNEKNKRVYDHYDPYNDLQEVYDRISNLLDKSLEEQEVDSS